MPRVGRRTILRARDEQRITLSDEAAARTFGTLSEEAARLLMGMLRVITTSGGTSGTIGDAVDTTTLTCSEAQLALSELRAVGLMQKTSRGTHRLHPLFGSIGHRLAEYSGSGPGNTGSGELIVLSPRVSS